MQVSRSVVHGRANKQMGECESEEKKQKKIKEKKTYPL